jgi:hypothetical protein
MSNGGSYQERQDYMPVYKLLQHRRCGVQLTQLSSFIVSWVRRYKVTWDNVGSVPTLQIVRNSANLAIPVAESNLNALHIVRPSDLGSGESSASSALGGLLLEEHRAGTSNADSRRRPMASTSMPGQSHPL